MISLADVARIERAAAVSNAAVVAPLARIEPGLSPASLPVAGGHLVLLGPGMYVNRGLALGLGVEVIAADFEAIEALAASAGVPAELEVSPWAHPSLLKAAAGRGYAPVSFRSTLLRHLQPEPAVVPGILTIEEVSDEAGLSAWQSTAAEGFGFTTPEERRISDLYTAAISQLDQSHLYVARLADRPVGVAALTVHDDVAILGGMTTVPSARGRGVQAELIRHRLAAAIEAGCDIATSTAAPASGSERNLLRNGFAIAATTLTVRRSEPEGSGRTMRGRESSVVGDTMTT